MRSLRSRILCEDYKVEFDFVFLLKQQEKEASHNWGHFEQSSWWATFQNSEGENSEKSVDIRRIFKKIFCRMLIYLKITVASIKFPKQIGRNSEGFRKNFLYIKKCIQKSEELAIFPYFRWKFGRILQILRIRRKTPNFGGGKRSAEHELKLNLG